MSQEYPVSRHVVSVMPRQMYSHITKFSPINYHLVISVRYFMSRSVDTY